jgi:WD40 repeat protein
MASGTEIKPPQRPKLRQLAPQARELVLAAHAEPGAPANLTISPGGKHVLLTWQRHLYESASSYSTKDQFELWDVSGPDAVKRWEKPVAWYSTAKAQFSPDGRWFANGARGDLELFDVTTGAKRTLRALEEEVPGHTIAHNAGQVQFSPDGKLLYCALGGDKLAVIDVAAGKQLALWRSAPGDVLAQALSPDGAWLALGAEDRTIRLWDTKAQREWVRWEGHNARVTALTFSPDSRLLVSGDHDGVLKLWDLPRIRRELANLGPAW